MKNGEYFLYGKFTKGVYTMEEIKLIPFLTGAIKEQQREIKNLEQQLKTVKKDILELKNNNNIINKKIDKNR